MGKAGKWIGVAMAVCVALYITKEPACLLAFFIAAWCD